jgi:hypothetical protein
LRPIIDAGYSRNDTGPFHGPTFSGGQFHPPTLDLPNAVVQPTPVRNAPLVAGISGTDTSTKADTGVAASTAPKNAVVTNAVDSALRPNADASSVNGDNGPISSGNQFDPPTVRLPATSIQDTAIKRGPLLNVIRGADSSPKTKVRDGTGGAPKNTAEQDSDDVGNTGVQSAGSTSSASSSAPSSTDTSQDSN